MKIVGKFLYFSLLLIAIFQSQAALANEAILDYIVTIDIQSDRSLLVTEEITVLAKGVHIRHGIYRDFPIKYQDKFGRRVIVAFDLKKVLLDGKKEDYHNEFVDGGRRTYLGHKDRYVPYGQHTYIINYLTDRQLGFFAKHDELYFNAIPHGFLFPIYKAKVYVNLPKNIPANELSLTAYTGAIGSKEKNYIAKAYNGSALFELTGSLPARQGMTIVVQFPKGLVAEPTDSDKFWWFVRDYTGALVGGFGVLLLFGYYLLTWSRVGRDPKTGIIIPLFEPPTGFSAPDVRYLEGRKFDSQVIAVALVELAVRGLIVINTEGDRSIVKLNNKGKVELSNDLQAVYDALPDTLSLKNSNHTKVKKVVDACEETLKLEHTSKSFNLNRKYFYFGLLFTFVIILVMLLGLDSEGVFVIAFFSVPIVFLISSLISFLTRPLARLANIDLRTWALTVRSSIVILLAVTCLFIPQIVFGESGWLPVLNIADIFILLFLMAINSAFLYLLEAPTISGRKVLDQIAGLKMYLNTAEKDTFKKLGAPDDSFEIFERFLPYAVALGVDYQWGQRFKSEIERAIADGTARSANQNLYRGTYQSQAFSSSGIASGLASTISSASSPPGSSSGGSSSGSSGGGGGGGGGGGW